MAEHTTVFITATTPGVGTRTYTEPGKKTSMDVNSLTANTEYIANAEYEDPNGVVIQTAQGYSFRTLPAGTFSIVSNSEQWVNNNDGTTSTLSFQFISTYAISSIIIQDNGVQERPQYQCTISGNTATATLPYYSPGTQHAMAFKFTDIYTEQDTHSRIMTLQPSMTETPFHIEVENLYGSDTVSLAKVGNPTSLTMQISYDNSTWENYTIGSSISLNSGRKRVYFRNSGSTRFSTSTSNYYKINCTGGFFKAGGNIASLKSSDMSDTTSQSCDFYGLFFRNTRLKYVNDLYLGNYTQLGYSCYSSIFSGCTALTTTPDLPATTLGEYCYSSMFYGCTDLATAPELQATTIAAHCYDHMFYNCTALTAAPDLPATTLEANCYDHMFSGCTGLTTAPKLPATTLVRYCYCDMFYGCTSLDIAPELPATALADSCYYEMFGSCIALTSSPILPATTPEANCYQYMFMGCRNLKEITCLAESTASSSFRSWVDGVASDGTFYRSPSASFWTIGVSGIPANWDVQDYQN